MRYDNITFIEKANKIHNNKFDYSLVNYIKSNIKIKIICPIHGIFEQTPVSHIRNNKPRGCPSCSGINKTTNQFIGEANKIHNNKYDYSKTEYINATTPIKIICPIHNDFIQKPSSHLSGWGCKACGGNNKLTTNEFIAKANKIHNNKYDYTKVEYVHSHSKIIITCPIHGDFTQKPNNHLNGANCPKCSKLIHSENRTHTTNDFIIKANIIHNNKYNYSNTIYSKSRNKINIKCPLHGTFTQNANSHLLGHGCPHCNESKGELKIKQILNEENIEYIFQKSFTNCRNKNNRKFKFDFFLPNKNILIEYDGKQHYEPIEYFGGVNSFRKLKEYDEIKNKFADEYKFKLIRISYLDYDKIKTILFEHIFLYRN